MVQYSALRCVSDIWQNNEKPLISNGLRFIVTCLPTAALWVLFHTRRHSWATIAKNEGIPISLISEGLGHTSEKTTQIYLNSFAVDTLNKVNENVADAVSDCIKNAGEKFICLHNTDKN